MNQAEEAAFLQKAAEAIRHVVRGYCRAGWRRFQSDMEQEAWVKVLEDRASFDPNKGTVFNWACMVTSRHLVVVLGRLSLPVHLPRGQLRRVRQGGAQITGVSFEGGTSGPDQRARSTDRPDQRYQQAEGLAIRSEWFGQVRRLVGQILNGWPKMEQQICQQLLGLEGPGRRPAEVAKLLGCRVERVYRAHQQLERAIKESPQLYVLFRQMGDRDEDVEEEGIEHDPTSRPVGQAGSD